MLLYICDAGTLLGLLPINHGGIALAWHIPGLVQFLFYMLVVLGVDLIGVLFLMLTKYFSSLCELHHLG